MSFVLLGILNAQAAGAGGFDYWLASIGGADDDIGFSVATDSIGNVYALGDVKSAGAGNEDFLLVKYNSGGVVQWQRTLGGGGADQAKSVAIDSSDNIYVFGYTRSSGEGSSDLLLAKYNSSGTIQWQRTLGGVSGERGYSVAIDSIDNIYVCGETDSSGEGSSDLSLAKYNSSGTVQWQVTLGGAGDDTGKAVAVDSSDNIYVCGETDSSGEGSDDWLIAKYNSSGTIQWQRTFGGTSFDQAWSVAVDSSDNIYVFGQARPVSDDFTLAKYNSSGTLQWQRVLGGAGGLNQGRSVAIDSLDSIYVLGLTGQTGAGSTDFLFAKYNSSGTIQLQRTLGGTSADIGEAIAVDVSDDIYLFGETSSTGEGIGDFLLAKVPNDGSLTGTYVLDGVNMVYAASSLTDTAGSFTSSTSALTASTSSLTAGTSSLTSAAATLTEHIAEIG